MKTVACIVLPGFTPFEFGITCEAFGLDRTDQGVPNFDFRVVTPDPGPVPTSLGVTMNVEHDLSFVAEADVVITTPIPRSTWGNVDERVLAAVRAAADRGAWLISACSGSFVLAAAGVLDGKDATTHWLYADTMTQMYPTINVDPDVLFVHDGTIITSAGSGAAIDACLYLLRLELGAEMVNTIARRMVVPPQREGGQAQFIGTPLPPSTSLSLAPVADWILGHLDEDLCVNALASKAHMSPRTFARRFRADFGTTPAAWLARQRVLRAQRLLEQTDLGLDAIAHDSGFSSAAMLRQAFARTLSTTPTGYRSRFQCTGEPVALQQ